MTREQFIQRNIDLAVGRTRDGLGRAHYERMRAGMHPEVAIAPWEELTERSREAYRLKVDYLMPVVHGVVVALITQAYDAGVPRALADLS